MARSDLKSALSALQRALRGTGVPHMIIGGIAVIARGVPRHTQDIDATIAGEGLDLANLVTGLGKQSIEPRIGSCVEFARQNQILLLCHVPSNTDIDLSLAWLPFEHEALARAELMRLRGVKVPVAQAEDLLVYKAVAWRDRDRTDIERLLELYGDQVDVKRVRAILVQFSEALDAPERIAEFDHLVSRVLHRPP